MRGEILTSSNIVAGHWVWLYEAARDNDFAMARTIYDEIFPLQRTVFSEVNPGPLRAAVRHAGLPAGPVADPLVDPSPAVQERLISALTRLGVAETD